ncbi:unnamed protein product, partial [Rotaria socialis]
GFFDLNILVPNATFPGLVVDCLPLQMTFASSLECFYNQTCLDTLLSTYSTMFDVEILNQSLPSRFPLTTSIESIVRELFVENFHIQASYNSYFNACAPVHCSYNRARRFNSIYIITTLIALYGGLNAAFYIITPYLIDLLLFVKERIFRRDRPQRDENDPFDILRGRISTWLYVTLLTTTMTFITVFTMNASYWTTVTIYSPSEKQYEALYQQYPDTIRCPCTSISNPYESFVQVTLRQHQVCESYFIQPWWYESFDSSLNSSIFISSYFRTLSMLCDITKTTLDDAIRQFSSTTFVSSHVRQKQFIVLQTDQLFSVLKSSVITEFNTIIALINEVLHTNQYISGRQTNILLKKLFSNDSNQARIIATTQAGYDDNGLPCYCSQNPLCNVETHYQDSTSWTIPGLSFKCFVFDSVLQSSLICWYNHRCLNEVLTKLVFFDTSNITILDDKLPSRFRSNTTIKLLLDQMMIEEWAATINYTAFYHNCYPTYCTYAYYAKQNALYLIATMMGIFGGLDVILRIVCLIVVRFLFRCKTAPPGVSTLFPNTPNTLTQHPRYHLLLCNVWNIIRHEIKTYNLFKSGFNQLHIINRERYSTRLYFFLLSIGIFIIIIYSISSKETVTEKIERPTLAMYEKLLQSNDSTWRCPCSDISISYSQFIKINITFHQICSSDFVQKSWLNLLFSNSSSLMYESSHFRMILSAYFNFLSTLCTLAQTTKHNDILRFLSEKCIGAQLMPVPLYQIVLEDAMYQMKGPRSGRLNRILGLIQGIAYGNTLISSYLLNWYWPLHNNSSQTLARAHAMTLDNSCSCRTHIDCVQPESIYSSAINSSHWMMPGLNIGCSIIDTIQNSTLQCLYNQTCIDLLQLFIQRSPERLPNNINVTALNSMLHTRYPPDTSILRMSDQLFFQEGLIEISYVEFYKQCAPNYCSYTFEKHSNFLVIISRILALWGGLTLSFGFLAPCIVRLWFQINTYRQNSRIHPAA